MKDTKADKIYPNIPKSVTIIDCTLRDGEQAPGVWFTIEEKVELARLLSDAGVDVLDAGFPVSNNSDMEVLQEISFLKLKSRIGATARPLIDDIIAAENSHVQEVFLFLPTSDLRLKKTMGITRKEACGKFRFGAEEVVSRGMLLNLVLEDSTRADPELLVKMISAVVPYVSVNRVILADSVGCAIPAKMEELVAALYKNFGSEISLCPHCHNDFGLAVANTLASIAAGANAVTCTVNGIGERAGNADLAETVASLSHLYRIRHSVNPRYLPALAHFVEKISGIHCSPTKAVTGLNVYRHESGIHIDALLKQKNSYEFLPPEWVGRNTEFVLGKHSGSALIKHFLRKANATFTDELIMQVMERVKMCMGRRRKTEHENAYKRKREFESNVLSGLDPSIIIQKQKVAEDING